MKKILFLDFDGVMDTQRYCEVCSRAGLPEADRHGTVFDPQCVESLRLIIEHTGADIVVSSSWIYVMSLRQLWDMWADRQLPGRVIDTTPAAPDSRKRGDDIAYWLQECRETCQYAIIDDMEERNFNSNQLDHLFVVDAYHGLDKATAQRIIEHLNDET